MSNKKPKILIVGQTPPPHNGQSIMIKKIVDGVYNTIQVFHVRMAFSKSINETGNVSVLKAFHLIKVVLLIIYYKIRFGIDVLYYPPSGPSKTAFYRDAILLIIARLFFNKVCFHFHAAGTSELYVNLNSPFKLLYRLAYYQADLGIRLSPLSTNDSLLMKVKRELIIPYGIEDATQFIDHPKKNDNQIVLLYVGLLSESKGVLRMINACKILKERKIEFSAIFVGEFKSDSFEQTARNAVDAFELQSIVKFMGVLVGEDKFEVFASSDIFCFPSFYEAESFPVVLLEACCFSLPIVSTSWRGIPSIVEEGKNGFLISKPDNVALADRLEILIRDKGLRTKMGDTSRDIFCSRYTISKYYENIEHALYSI